MNVAWLQSAGSILVAGGGIWAVAISRRKQTADVKLTDATAAEKAVVVVEKAMAVQGHRIDELERRVSGLTVNLDEALAHVRRCEDELAEMRRR